MKPTEEVFLKWGWDKFYKKERIQVVDIKNGIKGIYSVQPYSLNKFRTIVYEINGTFYLEVSFRVTRKKWFPKRTDVGGEYYVYPLDSFEDISDILDFFR